MKKTKLFKLLLSDSAEERKTAFRPSEIMVKALGLGAMITLSFFPCTEAGAVNLHSPVLKNDSQTWTGIGLQNTTSSEVRVKVHIYDENGRLEKEETRSVVPYGHLAFVPGQELQQGRYAFTIDLKQGVYSFALIGQSDEQGRFSMNQIPTTAARQAFSIPHVTTEDGWNTLCYVANVSEQACDITLLAYNNNGDQVAMKKFEKVAAHASLVFDLREEFTSFTGSLVVRSNVCGSIVTALEIFNPDMGYRTTINAIPLELEYKPGVKKAVDSLVYFDHGWGKTEIVIPEGLTVTDTNGNTLKGSTEIDGLGSILCNGKMISFAAYEPPDIEASFGQMDPDSEKMRATFRIRRLNMGLAVDEIRVYQNGTLVETGQLDEAGKATFYLSPEILNEEEHKYKYEYKVEISIRGIGSGEHIADYSEIFTGMEDNDSFDIDPGQNI